MANSPTYSKLSQLQDVDTTSLEAGQVLQFDSGTNTWGADYSPGVENSFNCATTVNVGDIVYVSGNNTIDKADNTNINTIPCIGIVGSKPTATTAIVKSSGKLSGFSGIIPGQRYYVGTNGTMITSPPIAVDSITQIVAIGLDNTTILMTISYNYVEN